MRLSSDNRFSGNISILDNQWQRIGTINWPIDVTVEDEKFWMAVYHHHDAVGERDFKELGSFALSMLSLPFSNASVERMFSQMNLIKNKIRNRMQLKSLASILHIRAFMQRNGICCQEFAPTSSMLALFTNDIYRKDADTDLDFLDF